LFVSVDGGATKTISVCYDVDGRILGVCATGPSNFRNVGVDAAKRNIVAGVKLALERAQARLEDLEEITFAMAGAKDSELSTRIVEQLVGELGFKKPYSLLNDGEAGFNCRFLHRDGIVVAAGTGMIAYLRLRGTLERSSGWGWLIGDEGGGFYIGRRALQIAAKMADGRLNGSHEFIDTVQRFFGAAEPRGLVDKVYTSPIDIRRIGLLAREVSRLASMGDQTARGLIEEAAFEAALSVIALKSRPGAQSLPVSGYGGVFRAGPLYWENIKRAVEARFPQTEYIEPLYGYHAVLGSVYLTLEKHGNKKFEETVVLQEFNRMVEHLPTTEKEKYLLLN
jgi:glucosamine kinase